MGAVVIWASGVLDRPGLEGAGEGLAIGAAVCAPLWLLSMWRKSREGRSRDD